MKHIQTIIMTSLLVLLLVSGCIQPREITVRVIPPDTEATSESAENESAESAEGESSEVTDQSAEAIENESTEVTENGSSEEISQSEAAGIEIEDPIDPEKVGRIVFMYERSFEIQVELNAYVTEITPAGAQVELEKRVGPMNYTGHRMEGDLTLDRDQIAELLEILTRYDIKGYNDLRTKSSATSPIRSLYVQEGDTQYYVAWNAKFPKTIPPQEDIMYFELYNFFNGLIAETPGWEEVISDNLEDPRENPAYGERIVEHFGHQVRLVPGTGVGSTDGRGAEIDYGDLKWWQEEGFTGTWVMTDEDRTYPELTASEAEFTVNEDGSAVLTLDGVVWKGAVSEKRYYKTGIYLPLEKDGDHRSCTVISFFEDSYKQIEIYWYPGPVPEEQLPPIDVCLTQVGFD